MSAIRFFFRSVRHYQRLYSFLGALGLVLLLHTGAIAQGVTVQSVKVIQVLDNPQVFIENKPAKVNDEAYRGQRVRTKEARAELTFNTGAIGRLSHNSVLTVGQCARLRKGILLVNGAVNGCTASVVAGVRGTTYVLEIKETGDAQIQVLEGEVTVAPQTLPDPDGPDSEPLDKSLDGKGSVKQTPFNDQPAKTKQFGIPIPSLPIPSSQPQPSPAPEESDPRPAAASTGEPPSNPPGNSDQKTVVVKGGEQVSVSSTGQVGGVVKLTQDDFIRLLRGDLFSGFAGQLPGLSKIQSTFQRLFPGIPFPISIPGIPGLPIPIPRPF
jgi:hypothetical protein